MIMRSIAAFAGVFSLALLLAGCGGRASKSTGLRISANNNCGSAYMVTSPTAQAATICGGVVGYPPVRVTLRRGERFKVSSATETTGKNFPALLAHGGVIKRTSNRGASADYVATRAGQAVLISKSRYCQRPVNGECVAFVVFVS